MSIRAATFTLAIAAAASAGSAEAALLPYYVGVDGLQTIASGTYAGLANPNYNRLTFLLAHTYPELPSSNHYHSKGVQIYSGPNLGAGTAVVTSASDYVPESANPPIPLAGGTGLYAGKLTTNAYASTDPAFETAQLAVGTTGSLAGFAAGSGESVLFNSSAGRWNGQYAAADVHWTLVSLTPGLHVGTDAALDVVTNPGDEVHLGSSADAFSFTPVLWTDAAALPGTYEAAFRLTDENGLFGDSGVVRVRTQVVPEPAALGLIGAVAAGVLRRKRRQG